MVIGKSITIGKMKALILSGGSNKGAVQVGALKAILENNINFDLVKGFWMLFSLQLHLFHSFPHINIKIWN